MASNEEMLDLVNCTVRFGADGGEYEGVIKQVIPAAKTAIVGKLILLPDCRMGTLNFGFSEMANLQVISRPNSSKDEKVTEKAILPVYPKTELEKLFDLDGGSDIESEECERAVYELKFAPHLSKFVPRDFEVIDGTNKDFNLAIKHIKAQDAIGVSLEGVKVSRSGTLTWLCISTRCCNFLFDILAIGEQAFSRGLKSILENAKIQKIMHDCRLPSDCLFHKYGVRLVNVFDTQVADYVVMMQMVEKDTIDDRVNTLDACLNYYLEVPYDYLYGEANFDDKKESLNFHALRPLKDSIKDVLIKNVMYLHLLKRELELALLTPVRRATDIYLNSIQKLEEKELSIVPHKPEELPLDMHLEGIQIFRYRNFEYLCNTVASGPPYRAIDNPIKSYLNYRAEYKSGQRKDRECVVNKFVNQNSEKALLQLKSDSNVNRPQTDNTTSNSGLSGVNSANSSSAEYSSDSDKENFANNHREAVRPSSAENGISKNQSNNVKHETSELNRPTVQRPSMRAALERLCRKSSEALKDAKSTSDESSPFQSFDADISNERIRVNGSVERSTFNISDGNSTVTSPIRPTSGRISPKEAWEMLLKDSIATSASGGKKSDDNVTTEISSVQDFSTVGHLQNHSAVKKDDLSDSEFEQILARVRRKGAMLRNQGTTSSTSVNTSTSHPFRGSAKLKSAETGGVSSTSAAPASESVDIYFSDVIDNPTQFTVKVNRKPTRLVDLYKKAGDANSLWAGEEQESVPNKPKSFGTDDLWAKIRAESSCKPMDEKLRLRLIPAGMSGY